MAKLETSALREEEPPLDSGAVQRAYRFHRARRAAREEQQRERRLAGFRFWLVVALVILVASLLAARTLGEVEHLFGL